MKNSNMKRFVPILAALVLGLATYKVYALRVQWASGDLDPEQLAILKRNLARLPKDLDGGTYVGTPYEVDVQTVKNAGADVYGSVMYSDSLDRTYRLYVGGAISSEENFHAPTYCMPASGWEVLEENTTPIPGWEDDDPPSMRRLVLQLGQQKMLVYFWFQAGSRIANHEFAVRIQRFKDLLFGEPLRPTMICSLYIPVPDTLEETELRAQEFVEALIPELRRAALDKADDK